MIVRGWPMLLAIVCMTRCCSDVRELTVHHSVVVELQLACTMCLNTRECEKFAGVDKL